MHGISTIQAHNAAVTDKASAASTTHFIVLPTGQIAISVLDKHGVEQKALLDEATGKKFLARLADQGDRSTVIHRRTVCREFVKTGKQPDANPQKTYHRAYSTGVSLFHDGSQQALTEKAAAAFLKKANALGDIQLANLVRSYF